MQIVFAIYGHCFIMKLFVDHNIQQYRCFNIETLLHIVTKHNVVFSQLKQHRIVEEFVNTHIFTQSLFKVHENSVE